MTYELSTLPPSLVALSTSAVFAYNRAVCSLQGQNASMKQCRYVQLNRVPRRYQPAICQPCQKADTPVTACTARPLILAIVRLIAPDSSRQSLYVSQCMCSTLRAASQ